MLLISNANISFPRLFYVLCDIQQHHSQIISSRHTTLKQRWWLVEYELMGWSTVYQLLSTFSQPWLNTDLICGWVLSSVRCRWAIFVDYNLCQRWKNHDSWLFSGPFTDFWKGSGLWGEGGTGGFDFETKFRGTAQFLVKTAWFWNNLPS